MAVAFAVAWPAAGGGAARGARLTVEPTVAPIDAPVALRLEGLRAGEEVTLRALTSDAEGRRWHSEAVFRAGAQGVVDAQADRPLRGSYTGADGMGLFWSLRPEAEPPRIDGPLAAPAGPAFPRPLSGTLQVRLEARVEGRLVASASAARGVTGAGVEARDVREQGLVGRVYETEGRRRPAVLVLGDGEGGVPDRYGGVLAGHGYVTLSLAYFGADGLPADLVEVPLEYFERALEWLRGRPSVDPDRLAVLGSGRGAEAALLLAATYPQVKAVVALAPSHVVWEGARRDLRRIGLAALQPGRSAWALRGRPLPFVPRTVTPEAVTAAAGGRLHAVDLMQPSRVDLLAVERARIRVEAIRGPVLLVSSLSDRTWPAAAMGDRIAEALRASRFPHRVEHLQYGGLSHSAPDAWLPVVHGGTLGGTAEGTMRAFASYWPALLSFLDRSLRAPG